MVRPSVLLVAACLAAALLSGCAATEPRHEAPPAGLTTGDGKVVQSAGGQPVTPPAPAGPSQPHGQPQRDESPVQTGQDRNGVWYARQVITLHNGVAGFTRASDQVALASGPITQRGADAGEYRTAVHLEGRGATEDLARQELGRLSVVHDDHEDAGRLVLATHVEHTPLLTIPVPGNPIEIDPGANWNASIDEVLPAHLVYDLDASTASGAIRMESLHAAVVDASSASGAISTKDLAASKVTLSTSSGAISAHGLAINTLSTDSASGSIDVGATHAAKFHAGSASGAIRFEGTVDDVDIGTASGAVTATLTPAASGKYDISASSGALHLNLGRPEGSAYDITASTASGNLAVHLSDGKSVGSQTERNVHLQSQGYDNAVTKTTVDLSTSSGAISASD